MRLTNRLLILSSRPPRPSARPDGPSQLAFAAGAGLRLRPTEEMPALCSGITCARQC